MKTNRYTCLTIAAVVGCALFLGCSRLALRLPITRVFKEEDVEQAINALGTRQDALKNFKARVKFTIESPDLKRSQRFSGNIAVEMPDKLRLVSTGPFGRKLFDLISVEKSFLLHLPSEQKVFFEKEGVEVESLPFSVSPSDIARELFVPEDWGSTDLDDVRLMSQRGRRMSLEMCPDGRVERELLVQPPKWLLVRNELYAEDGALRAVTVLGRYRQLEGIWLPTHLEAHYPLRDTRLVMRISKVEVNTQLNPKLFVFPKRLLAIARRQRQSER
jgi:outer membrane lipoprotein-sorting protein